VVQQKLLALDGAELDGLIRGGGAAAVDANEWELVSAIAAVRCFVVG
jgi:hypothetical protein